MTSSGSDASVKALNPRRSQNAPSPPGGGLPKSSRAHPRSQKSPQTVDPLDCRDLLHDANGSNSRVGRFGPSAAPLARGCFLLQTFCPPAGIRIEALGALASALTTNADP
jgi:hypothetical protein